MLSLLNVTLSWRRTLLPLTLFLTLVVSIATGGATSQARAASDAHKQPASSTCKTSSTPPAPSSWKTNGTQIIGTTQTGQQSFTIAGINWYGFETKSFVAHGLYSQDCTTILTTIREFGYNTIRFPFSNQMWETDPIPRPNAISACPSCQGLHSRDILANIINYAGSIGLHIILDNHRSEAGNSAEANGLWYTSSYPEQSWINDWLHIQQWVHGVTQTQGATDTITVNLTASDGLPIVLGYDLRDEPHTPSRTPYLQGATWGTGDGIVPTANPNNPNPNPFAPACVASSTCHDWRLAAERAADTTLGDPTASQAPPLIFVEGTGQYPKPGWTNDNSGQFDFYWWGGDLQGVNGNTGINPTTGKTVTNPGAPIVLNVGKNPQSSMGLGLDADSQLVYSAHDYGPSTFVEGWFNPSTCYVSMCSSSSLADVWNKHWAYINVGNVQPYNTQGSQSAYPWSNTGSTAYSQTPVYLGEFGTGNADSDLMLVDDGDSSNFPVPDGDNDADDPGSEGQWFTDMVNFILSSYNGSDNSLIPVTNLQWTYWALNTEDSFALLGSGYTGLANRKKEYTFLCSIQRPPFAISPGQGCGSTGSLPGPM